MYTIIIFCVLYISKNFILFPSQMHHILLKRMITILPFLNKICHSFDLDIPDDVHFLYFSRTPRNPLLLPVRGGRPQPTNIRPFIHFDLICFPNYQEFSSESMMERPHQVNLKIPGNENNCPLSFVSLLAAITNIFQCHYIGLLLKSIE